MGQIDPAIVELRRALQTEPRSVASRVDLALALLAKGDVAGAGEQLQQANQGTPQIREANNLAWILATAPDDSLRNSAEALRLAEFACLASDYRHADLLDTLAAHASSGDLAAAIERVDQAIELARADQNDALRQALLQRKSLYEQGRPYRDPQLTAGAQAK